MSGMIIPFNYTILIIKNFKTRIIMKKVFIISAFMLGFVSFTMAQNKLLATHEVVYIQQDGFEAIAIDDLPDAVKKAVDRDYEGASVSEAYMNEHRQYKLILNVEETPKTVYANEKGEWITAE